MFISIVIKMSKCMFFLLFFCGIYLFKVRGEMFTLWLKPTGIKAAVLFSNKDVRPV